MDRADPRQQRSIGNGVGRGLPMPPGVKARFRHAEHARHHSNGKHRLVRAPECEDPGGIAPVSRANQAAARERMSRSSRNGLFSRRRRASSSLGRRQSNTLLLPAALLPVGLRNPMADRLRRRLKLPSELRRVTTGADQFNHLAAELRRIRRAGSRHL